MIACQAHVRCPDALQVHKLFDLRDNMEGSLAHVNMEGQETMTHQCGEPGSVRWLSTGTDYIHYVYLAH
jgi:hypothetical protein